MVHILPLPLWLEWVLLGAIGALANYLFVQFTKPEKDWHIVLPSYKDGKLYLGVVMYLVLGGVAGWFAPSVIGNGVNSLLAGYTFSSVFESISKRTRNSSV